METVISVKGLSKSFGDKLILDNLSFELYKGQTTAIIGPSGSGKSTMLRCLINLEKVDSGTVMIEDNCLVQDGSYKDDKTTRKICLKMGMVFQNFNLFPHLNVLNNLIYAPIHVKKMEKSKALEMAKGILIKVGLSGFETAMPAKLSGGQKQRVAIARALMNEPDILLFDEPTSSLDPELTIEVLNVMKDLANERMTMVVVTHEMQFAKEVSHRVLFMDDKHIIADDEPSVIFNNPPLKRIADFIGQVTYM